MSIAGLVIISQFLHPFAVRAADVIDYVVQKGIELTQTNAAPANPDSNNGYVFQAWLDCVTNSVTGASIQPPGLLPITLVAQPGNEQLKYKKKCDSISKLNKNAPNGRYAFAIKTVHDGTLTPALLVQGDLYPSSPHLLVYDAVQSLDAGSYVNLRWEYVGDGTLPDFVQVRIEDSGGNLVFETPDGGRNALSGADTSLLLSPNILSPNQNYQGTITASRTIAYDTNSFPGAIGTGLYYRRLKFAIRTTPVASSADLKIFEVLKIQLYEQKSTNPPTAITNNSFLFHAQVDASITNCLLLAEVKSPLLTTTNLVPSPNGTRFEFEVNFDTLNELNTNYPSGTFALNVVGATQGGHTVSLRLPVDQYLAADQFTNVTDAQALDPAQDFILHWMPMTGASSSDFIHLQIEDDLGNKVFETDDPGRPKALAGPRTSARIPDHTLKPGSHYTAKLLFIKVAVLDTTSYPGALGIAGFARETRMGINTTGGLISPARLTNARWGAQGFSFTLGGTPSWNYRIDSSSNLVSWTPIGNASPLATGEALFTDTNSIHSGLQFYRVVIP